jgi:hypothetical protein
VIASIGRSCPHCDPPSFDGKPPLTQPSQRGILSGLGRFSFGCGGFPVGRGWHSIGLAIVCLKESNWVGSMIGREAELGTKLAHYANAYKKCSSNVNETSKNPCKLKPNIKLKLISSIFFFFNLLIQNQSRSK